MTRIALTALAFAAMSSVAVAQPAQLSDQQLDQAVAGFFNQTNFNATGQGSEATAVNVCAECEGGALALSKNVNVTIQKIINF